MDREGRVGVCLGCSGDDLIVYAVRPSARYVYGLYSIHGGE